MTAEQTPGFSLPDGEIIYGRHALQEALAAGEEILEIHLSETARPHGVLGQALNVARSRGIPMKWMPPQALDRAFERAGGRGRHQGVIALVPGFRYADLAEMLAAAISAGEPPFLLVLDAVQDVHNLGSLIRTADAAGVHGVLLPEREGARVTPAVRNASAGAVAHVRIGRVDLVSALDELRRRAVRVVGLEEMGPIVYSAADFTGPLALVVGGEGQGLHRAVAARCDVIVRLPMRGRVESLNAAVAGSVVLYEALRQRQPGE